MNRRSFLKAAAVVPLAVAGVTAVKPKPSATYQHGPAVIDWTPGSLDKYEADFMLAEFKDRNSITLPVGCRYFPIQ